VRGHSHSIVFSRDRVIYSPPRLDEREWEAGAAATDILSPPRLTHDWTEEPANGGPFLSRGVRIITGI